MPRAYRITKARHTGSAFDGEGARLQGGRWSGVGTRIVYTSGSLSLAILEILVHLQQAAFLAGYVFFEIEFADNLVQDLEPALLPPKWRISPAPPGTIRIGDKWIADSPSAVLRVPSVIVPSEHNFLINPTHREFSSIVIGDPRPLDIDHRLLGN
jgi:RES domain-containing protein